MTYFGVLFRFVVIPIVILVFLHYWHEKRNKPIPRQFSLLSPVRDVGFADRDRGDLYHAMG
jgi:hypothetical protein